MKKSLLLFLICVILLGLTSAAAAELNAGDIFTMGRFEQDDDPDDGREPIEWQVLKVEDGRALVISKYGLDSRWYHYPKADITWKDSSLRKWLNGDFYNDSFEEDERDRILEVTVSTPGDPEKGTDGGGDTTDRLFVLSIGEAETYFASDEERKGEATVYEKNHGAFVRSSTGMSDWWLRNPGSDNMHAAIVDGGGKIVRTGNSLNNVSTTVRPAFWLDLTAGEISPVQTGTGGSILLSGFFDLDELTAKAGKGSAPAIISLDEAEALGLKIPEAAEGEVLYLGEGSTEQAEKFLAAFTMEPDVPEIRNLNLLIYQANFESGGVRADGLTLSVKSDSVYTITDGSVDGGNISFTDFALTDWGAEAVFTYTLTLPQPAGFQFTFDKADMTFVKQGDAAAPEQPAAETTVPEETVSPENTETPDLRAGDRIILGHYEQDDLLSNGPEPIEWRVLAVEDGQALLISEYGLDGKRFHNRGAGAYWQDSSLREWMNGEFLDGIFTPEERKQIIEGDDVLFLLSKDEAKTLFASDEDRVCSATVYAESHGTNKWWWLGTQEYSERQASAVHEDGSVSSTGNTVMAKQMIRPAFRLDLAEYAKADHELPADHGSAQTVSDAGLPEGTRIGDLITLGHFEQDNDEKNGPEPVQWRILSAENGSALLISEYGLEGRNFHNRSESVDWHGSTLREWLNGEFFEALFSDDEKALIPDSEDKVFLLSVREASELFASDEERMCIPTAYAARDDLYVHEETGTSWWWLRTQGYLNDNQAACVHEDGEVDDDGQGVIFTELVRPAVRLDLEAYGRAPKAASAEEPLPAEEGSIEAAEVEEISAEEIPAEDEPEVPAVVIPEDLEAGDIFTFGRYVQDDDPDSSAEPIEWLVLEVKKNRALVISNMILDAEPYDKSTSPVTWETSTLRSWLNLEFLLSAFNEEEQAYIRETLIENPDNPVFDTGGGKDTRDRIFLLSMDEAEEYFPEDWDRMAEATPYAAAKNAFTDSMTGNSWWWLRTPGRKGTEAVNVGVEGWIMERGMFNENLSVGVRPAFWLSLSAGEDPAGTDGDLSDEDYGIVEATNDVGTLLRRGPGYSEEIFRSILNGTRIELLGETRYVDGQDWTRVRTKEGQTGWVLSATIDAE